MAVIGNIKKYGLKEIPVVGDRVFGWDNVKQELISFKVEDLSGATIENPIQNNKIITIELGEIPKGLSVSEIINQLQTFEVADDEIASFLATESIILSDNSIQITNLIYFLKTGKGIYGDGNTQINNNDLINVKSEVTLFDSGEENVAPEVYTLYNIAGNTYLNAINNSSAQYVISSNADVYFVIHNVSGENGKKTYRFVGANGTYGQGATQVQASDLLKIEENQLTQSANIRIRQTPVMGINDYQEKSFKINIRPSFEILDNEIWLANFKEFRILNYANKSGTLPPISQTEIWESSYFITKGKGIYGYGGTPLNEDDLILNNEKLVSQPDIPVPDLDDTDVAIIPAPSGGYTNPVDDINNSETTIKKEESTTTIVIEHDEDYYLFKGGVGEYGKNKTQIDDTFLEKIEPLSETVSQSNIFTKKIVLTPSDIKAAENTFIPIASIPAPDSQHIIICLDSQIEIIYGNLAFDGDIEFEIKTDGQSSSQLISDDSIMSVIENQISVLEVNNQKGSMYARGKGLGYISTTGTSITQGNSTVIIYLNYMIKNVGSINQYENS